eukprot:4342121-Pyramimonas_sp.AAC.1
MIDAQVPRVARALHPCNLKQPPGDIAADPGGVAQGPGLFDGGLELHLLQVLHEVPRGTNQ